MVKKIKTYLESLEQNTNNHLINYYGITLKEYKVMLASQNDVCAICK